MGELVEMGLDAAEMEARARQPPPLLVAFRFVADGLPVDRAYQWVEALKGKDERQFTMDYRKWEKEYKETLALLGPSGGRGLSVGDVGTERCLELVERLLKGGGDGPGD